MTPSATPVMACLKAVSTTSPAANNPRMLVFDFLSIIISSFSLVFIPKSFARPEIGSLPISMNNPSMLNSFFLLYGLSKII